MRKRHCIPLALLAMTCVMIENAHAATSHAVLPMDDNAWRSDPPGLPAGGRFAVISGDPTKPESFVMRVELPAGYVVSPYRRSSDESIVVLAGAIEIGLGDVFDAAAMRTLPSGSFIRLPSNESHFVTTKLGATVQIFGTGPFEIEPAAQ